MKRSDAIRKVIALRAIADPKNNASKSEQETALRLADVLVKRYQITEIEIAARRSLEPAIEQEAVFHHGPFEFFVDGVGFGFNSNSATTGTDTMTEVYFQ